MQPKGLTFDQFHEGDVFQSGRRTITETDIVNFAGLSGDYNPLHMDHEFAKEMHGGIIAHGALTFSITTGLMNATGLVDGTCIAFLGPSFNYLQVVRPGDTIHVEQTVTNTHLSSKGDKGVVTFHIRTLNQRDEAVLEGDFKLLIKR